MNVGTILIAVLWGLISGLLVNEFNVDPLVAFGVLIIGGALLARLLVAMERRELRRYY